MPRHVESRESDYRARNSSLTWCSTSRNTRTSFRGVSVPSITARGEGSFEADLSIGFRKLRARYGSRVEYARPSRIDVSLAYGPFRHLVNHWRFTSLALEQTVITFELDFEFRSTLLSAAMTPLFGSSGKAHGVRV